MSAIPSNTVHTPKDGSVSTSPSVGAGAGGGGGESTSTAVAIPQENDMTTLSHAIIEWRRLTDEVIEYRQQIRERAKKVKALEEVILRIMKAHNIGALDLKSSGGRILYKTTKRQAALGARVLQQHLAEYLQSEQRAVEVMNFIQERRETVTKESIAYEKI